MLFRSQLDLGNAAVRAEALSRKVAPARAERHDVDLRRLRPLDRRAERVDRRQGHRGHPRGSGVDEAQLRVGMLTAAEFERIRARWREVADASWDGQT